ncbi:MAG: dimethylsulfonioproprionate lyase family protein [Pseudomonadota bacterium]
MSRFSLSNECALRALADEVAAAIQGGLDANDGWAVQIPSLDAAVYQPPAEAQTPARPYAHRHVAGIRKSRLPSRMQALFEHFSQLENLLIWGHAPGYTEERVGREFLDNYCHALLSGPDGPLVCAAPLGAFVLFGPDTLYKEHHHAPNEVYLAVSGGGEWKVGAHPWTPVAAGQRVFIPSNTEHAIRAGAESLLTFSFWLDEGEMTAISI